MEIEIELEDNQERENRRQTGNHIESFIRYEQAFNELFKEVGLKPAQCQLIRAFLAVSEGKSEFEASDFDLAKVLYKTDGKYNKTLSESIKYSRRVLEEWQQKNNLNLIEVIEKGKRIKSSKKGFNYTKTKYKFVLLAELASEIQRNPENINAVIKRVIEKIKEEFVPIEKPSKYRPRHLMKKAKNTIFTKFKRIFEFALEAGDEPVAYCKKILDDSLIILNELERERRTNQNREEFITQFESKLNHKLSDELKENNSNL